MKSISKVVSIILVVCVVSVFAEDKRDKQLEELAAIKAELKPLREKAYLESDVIATRRKLDESYKAYWESVRAAMLRLDPSKAKVIERDIALRKEIGPVAGSRAGDYEKKAAKASSEKPE